ncbi:FHA domain-containing protein, partial [Janibacter anophelis]
PAGAEPALPVAAGGPAHVQAARDDAPGHEPGGGRPQFADGHLVGSRVPQAGAAPAAPAASTGQMVADSGPAPAAPESADQSGVISAVPWGEDAAASGPAPSVEPVGGPAPGPAPGAPGMPFGLPSLPTPDHAGAPQPEAPEPEGESEGPMVLAVRCSLGHLNAPHATRCRVCGQDLPTQQPEQTLRPALGHLRMSTGDLVTLDRGVLIGRAPRSSETGPRSPHLVRISSPDNEISRNHVEIVLDGWHVLVRDLGSTNGTTVALPGSSPVRVRPGDQQTIEPGTTITLADQVSMVFEVTG